MFDLFFSALHVVGTPSFMHTKLHTDVEIFVPSSHSAKFILLGNLTPRQMVVPAWIQSSPPVAGAERPATEYSCLRWNPSRPSGRRSSATRLQTERLVHLTYVPCSPRLNWLDGLRVLPITLPRTEP